MSDLYNPLHSLKAGNWFKLICGASFQHLPAVRNLTLAYTLAGADCIDVAADSAVIAAAQEALQVASNLMAVNQRRSWRSPQLPLLMVSLNDGQDPHFRKAEFNSAQCPSDCPRPCEKICPAGAIVFQGDEASGVVQERCYGCGRCLPICPQQLIYTRSYVSTPGGIAPLVLSTGIDAIEIHTQVGRLAEFERLWRAIAPWINQLKLVAISCPDGEGMIDYLWSLYNLIAPLPCPLIWQTDGRPMSGDIGDGTTLAAVKLAQKVLAANLPGYVQLAGGTNSYTVTKLQAAGLLKTSIEVQSNKKQKKVTNLSPLARQLLQRGGIGVPSGDGGRPPQRTGSSCLSPSKKSISGIAYGSYARVLLSPILDQLETIEMNNLNVVMPIRLESKPQLLSQAVALADSLVSQIKSLPR